MSASPPHPISTTFMPQTTSSSCPDKSFYAWVSIRGRRCPLFSSRTEEGGKRVITYMESIENEFFSVTLQNNVPLSQAQDGVNTVLRLDGTLLVCSLYLVFLRC